MGQLVLMKNYLLGVLVVFCGLSCGGGETPLFVMEVDAELIIPAGLNSLDSHYFIVRDVPTRIANYAVNTFNDIDRIQSSNARLQGRVQEIDYSIVDQITIDVISKSDPSNQKEIFYNNLIPFNRDEELTLLSSLSNVSDILTEDLIDLEIRLIFKTFTPTELDTRLFMTFNAYATE